MPTKHDDAIFVGAGDDDSLRLPSGDDLLASLRFHPREGRITLGDERMVLLHVDALAELRRGLIDAFGIERARGTLVRVGYTAGHRDALHARTLRADASAYELLAAGPQLHALEGMVHVTPVEVRFDIERGRYHGEFTWKNSAEVDAHLRLVGASVDPVCWTLVGYASGYTSAFMGRPIAYRELGCRACGARRCRILGKPLEAWDPPLPEFAFLTREPLTPAAETLEVRDADALVGASSASRAVWSQIQRVAATETPVLLCGETGTGKDTLARALHAHGRRSGGPFVVVPCGALAAADPEALAARIREAQGGSLYLDTIEALAPALQAALIHHLDATPDLRVIASARIDLLAEPSSGRVSPALLHRIGAYPVYVPPLRERRDDLTPLMGALLGAHASRLGRRVLGFTARACAALADHDFPGNLRELSNLIERAVVLVADDGAIDVGHLFGGLERPLSQLGLGADGSLRSSGAPAAAPRAEPDADLVDRLLDERTPLEAIESALIRSAVARAGGNLSAAARTLGLTRPQLAYRYRKAGGEDPGE